MTVATLQDHVGVFEGTLTDEERRASASRFNATYAWDGESEDEGDEPMREMLFRETEPLSRDPQAEQCLLNAADDGCGGVAQG